MTQVSITNNFPVVGLLPVCMRSCVIKHVLNAFVSLCMFLGPFWHRIAALERSQHGRWLLVCRVWTLTGCRIQQTQTSGWRKMLPRRGCRTLILSPFLTFAPHHFQFFLRIFCHLPFCAFPFVFLFPLLEKYSASTNKGQTKANKQ